MEKSVRERKTETHFISDLHSYIYLCDAFHITILLFHTSAYGIRYALKSDNSTNGKQKKHEAFKTNQNNNKKYE